MTAVIVGEMRAIDWASSAGNPSASGRSADDATALVDGGCVRTLVTRLRPPEVG
jgi:hypothetical protein